MLSTQAPSISIRGWRSSTVATGSTTAGAGFCSARPSVCSPGAHQSKGKWCSFSERREIEVCAWIQRYWRSGRYQASARAAVPRSEVAPVQTGGNGRGHA
jgi:hypothetical protein